MEDNEQLEQFCVAERVGLVATGLVDAVEDQDGHGVHARNGDRDSDIEEIVIHRWRDVEGLLPCRLSNLGSWNGRGEFAGREFQERRGWEADANGLRAIGAGHVEVVHGGGSDRERPRGEWKYQPDINRANGGGGQTSDYI